MFIAHEPIHIRIIKVNRLVQLPQTTMRPAHSADPCIDPGIDSFYQMVTYGATLALFPLCNLVSSEQTSGFNANSARMQYALHLIKVSILSNQ